MNNFWIKVISAALLWVVSLISGVLAPYLFWRISPQYRRRSTCLQDEESGGIEEGPSDESDELIVSNRGQSSRGCFRCVRRAAAYFRTKCAGGGLSSIVYCLCGGVFLGVSLLDLIPESRSGVRDALANAKISTEFPLAEFVITTGFLVVMTLENLVSSCVLSGQPHGDQLARRRSSSDTHDSEECGEGSVESRAGHSRHYGGKDNVSSFRMYILILTLSFHSVFEGLAIGLQKDLTSLMQLVVAVSVHKAVLTFGVGLPLFETFGRAAKVKTACACAMIFCSASPLGCLAGAFVSGDSFQSTLGTLAASAILQCLATGTFLYVTFVEVLPKEFSHHHSKDHRDQNGVADQQNVNSPDRRRSPQPYKVSSRHAHKGESRLIKLLALIVGFSIASALQFL